MEKSFKDLILLLSEVENLGPPTGDPTYLPQFLMYTEGYSHPDKERLGLSHYLETLDPVKDAELYQQVREIVKNGYVLLANALVSAGEKLYGPMEFEQWRKSVLTGHETATPSVVGGTMKIPSLKSILEYWGGAEGLGLDPAAVKKTLQAAEGEMPAYIHDQIREKFAQTKYVIERALSEGTLVAKMVYPRDDTSVRFRDHGPARYRHDAYMTPSELVHWVDGYENVPPEFAELVSPQKIQELGDIAKLPMIALQIEDQLKDFATKAAAGEKINRSAFIGRDEPDGKYHPGIFDHIQHYGEEAFEKFIENLQDKVDFFWSLAEDDDEPTVTTPEAEQKKPPELRDIRKAEQAFEALKTAFETEDFMGENEVRFIHTEGGYTYESEEFLDRGNEYASGLQNGIYPTMEVIGNDYSLVTFTQDQVREMEKPLYQGAIQHLLGEFEAQNEGWEEKVAIGMPVSDAINLSTSYQPPLYTMIERAGGAEALGFNAEKINTVVHRASLKYLDQQIEAMKKAEAEEALLPNAVERLTQIKKHVEAFGPIPSDYRDFVTLSNMERLNAIAKENEQINGIVRDLEWTEQKYQNGQRVIQGMFIGETGSDGLFKRIEQAGGYGKLETRIPGIESRVKELWRHAVPGMHDKYFDPRSLTL